MSCKFLDVEGHCLVVYQISNEYFEPSPEDCSKCMRCEEGAGVNEFTMLQAKLNGVQLHKDLLGRGPGSRLAYMISWMNFTDKHCNACTNRKTLMDLWGPKGCEENRDTIRMWLRQSSRENIGFVPDCILDTIITAAIKTSPLPEKKKEDNQTTDTVY